MELNVKKSYSGLVGAAAMLGVVALFGIFIAACFSLSGFIIMTLWNYGVTSLFEVKTINFIQSLWASLILAFISQFFKSGSSSK